MVRRARLAVRGLAFVVCAALAFSGSAAHAEGEPGYFSWQPSLHASLTANDNVFHEDNGESGSLGVWLAPRLELGYRTGAVELGADLGVDLRRYVKHSSALSAELFRAIGWGEIGLSPGLSLRVSNAFVPQPVRVGLPEDEASNQVQTNRLDAGLHWWRELPGRRELEAGLLGSYFSSEKYSQVVPLEGGGFAVDDDFRADYAQGLGFVEFQSPLAERTSTYVRGQLAYRAFSEGSAADHSNFSLLFGVRSSRWEGLDLALAAGVGGLSFDSFADALRVLGELNLGYRLPSGWRFSLAARHLMTPNLAGDDAMESTGQLGVEKRFGTATAASVRLFVTRFDGDLRADAANLFGGVELRIRRQVSRHLQLALSYRHLRNRGGFDLDITPVGRDHAVKIALKDLHVRPLDLKPVADLVQQLLETELAVDSLALITMIITRAGDITYTDSTKRPNIAALRGITVGGER